MVLISKGKGGILKCFDPILLSYIEEKRNTEAEYMLRMSSYSLKSMISMKDSSGAILLHYAAQHGNEPITQLLLQLGSGIDTQTDLGKTPLMLAVERRHEHTVQILLKKNAKMCITDKRGQSALQLALDMKPISLGIVRAIFEERSIEDVLKCIENESEELLADKLHDAEFTVLHSVFFRNVVLTESLLSYGFPIHFAYSSSLKTALHLAVEYGDLENVKQLIQFGANVNPMDSKRCTPFFRLYNPDYEQSSNRLEMLKFFIFAGANLTEINHDGVMQVYSILRYGDRAAVRMIVESGLDLKAFDLNRDTPLIYLAHNPNAYVIEEIRGKEFNVNWRNRFGKTALHVAAREGIRDTVKFLLDHGAENK